MAEIVRQKLMSVPAAALYRAITDFENYPEFLSEVKSAEVISSTKKKARVAFELEVMKRFKYVLEFQMTPESEVSWKLIESDFFKVNEGMWKLEAKGKSETDVEYSLEVGFGFLVPGFVTKTLTQVNLPHMFDAFEKRAKSYGRK